MKTIMALSMLLLLTSMTVVAQGTGTTTLSGYVVDQHCAATIGTKADVMDKAAAHTKDCALMEDCVKSGYGIFSGGKYYKFDSTGSATAQTALEGSKLSKGMYFTAVGKDMNGTFHLTSLTAAIAPKKMELLPKSK
jgi:hypothetical protein